MSSWVRWWRGAVTPSPPTTHQYQADDDDDVCVCVLCGSIIRFPNFYRDTHELMMICLYCSWGRDRYREIQSLDWMGQMEEMEEMEHAESMPYQDEREIQNIEIATSLSLYVESAHSKTRRRLNVAGVDALVMRVGGKDAGNCPVCLDDMWCTAIKALPCHASHVFHASCIDRWLMGEMATCPLCKLDVPDAPQVADTSTLTTVQRAKYCRTPSSMTT
jgi:hypothetical protein